MPKRGKRRVNYWNKESYNYRREPNNYGAQLLTICSPGKEKIVRISQPSLSSYQCLPLTESNHKPDHKAEPANAVLRNQPHRAQSTLHKDGDRFGGINENYPVK